MEPPKREVMSIPVSQKQLLQFEAEFGRYARVNRMALESPDGPRPIEGGYYISETLHRLRIYDGFLLSPPEDDPKMLYFLRKIFVKALAVEAQVRFEQAKSRLKSQCAESLSKPTKKQLDFVRSLKRAAEEAMNAYQELLRPEVQAKEEEQRRENDKRLTKHRLNKQVEQALDAL